MDTLTVTGKTLGENIAGREVKDYEVIHPIDQPFSEQGGLAVLFGNLAPDGAIIKTGGVKTGLPAMKDLRLSLIHRKKRLTASSTVK